MRILSFKPGHDGAVAFLDEGRLVFSLESEKDSYPRYGDITPAVVAEAMELCDALPDVICLGGWVKGYNVNERPIGAGYYGWQDNSVRHGTTKVFGKQVKTFTSSHERSHLMSAYGMSPFVNERPCYGLVWEGYIGSFYEYGPRGEVTLIQEVMREAGIKYQYLFSLADPTTTTDFGGFRFSNAGKLMALAAFGAPDRVGPEGRALIEFILDQRDILQTVPKANLADSPYHDIGVRSPEFTDLAAAHSQRIFEQFHDVAARKLTKGYPLIISGGCGLNCDWNSQWRESGLFEDVFIPPVPNDAGSALGTAVDAQRHFTGDARIEWDPYAGAEFRHDLDRPGARFEHDPSGLDGAARVLADGGIIAWVQGRCEIGPRALGNRSILASASVPDMQARLNHVKGREDYRPIAPVCRAEDVEEFFHWSAPSPYMLHFQKVRDPRRLPAVTHVDGTARTQTVTAEENAALHDLLGRFGTLSGVPVLCNTSLNFNGTGFINRTSDLVDYVLTRDLAGFWLDGSFYRTRKTGNR
ncbi:hydroxymethyl cephem carbamoyltransferase [Amycolatopsis bartoniae]|uniref:Nodulation protein U n=1 Tax=Amycolatopsis bartoniae TaxID=941986 RepID=A0A8H9IP20_9PSEU|nr:carbamoyltransferase C-terminal domain-containing protein [Amycolatopsis bartoniae]MBB2939997.1 hydroxymethyl cephem carbamoyltransferase [Amycolatopsis bartoniae]TVT09964.1 proline dehydrogenase [Amycolatopsis bartoniae]GHF32126.1 nodulation protein U [Amycolatopsis bartoniae]